MRRILRVVCPAGRTGFPAGVDGSQLAWGHVDSGCAAAREKEHRRQRHAIHRCCTRIRTRIRSSVRATCSMPHRGARRTRSARNDRRAGGAPHGARNMHTHATCMPHNTTQHPMGPPSTVQYTLTSHATTPHTMRCHAMHSAQRTATAPYMTHGVSASHILVSRPKIHAPEVPVRDK